jgi:hypothetical protein
MVLTKINRVPKNGENKFHNYKFVTESDLSDAVRAHLGEVGVFIFTDQAEVTRTEWKKTSRGEEQWMTRVKLTHTFVDGDTGETFSVTSYGEGIDGGDKGLYKSITGATKYFLYKNFLISTGDDPERENDNERRQDREEAGSDGRYARRERVNPDGDGGRSRQQQSTGAAAGTAQQEKKAPEVPRDPEVKLGDMLPNGEKWENVVIHFGKKYKSKKLGELTPEQINAWADEWNPFADAEGNRREASDEDKHLRIALNAYKRERDAKQ